MAVPLSAGGQNAWATRGYASCHDWPVHLGMSGHELVFLLGAGGGLGLGLEMLKFSPVRGALGFVHSLDGSGPGDLVRLCSLFRCLLSCLRCVPASGAAELFQAPLV